MCPQNHDMTDAANVYITEGGKRHCRTCRRDRVAALRKSKRSFGPRPIQPRLVYFISDAVGHVKIGVAENPHGRLLDLQTANATELRIEATQDGGFAVERALHRLFADDHIQGEWFHFTPAIAQHIDALAEL